MLAVLSFVCRGRETISFLVVLRLSPSVWKYDTFFKERTCKVKICPVCGRKRSALAYARARAVRLSIKREYRDLDKQSILQNVQMEWRASVYRLFDIDRVRDWASTTSLTFVGRTGQRKHHPLRVYLNIADPTNQAHPRWDVYSCACDALKPFSSTSHTSGLTLYHNPVILDGHVTMDAYHPLPTWAQNVMRYLEPLPYNGKITRELFCSILAGVPLNSERNPL